jgi:hypothetical protein
MNKQVVPTAKEINEAHQFAKECAESAVEWAIKCGTLLTAKKAAINSGTRGHWEAWVTGSCDFSLRTAQRYMEASKKGGEGDTRVAFDSIRQLLGHDKPKAKPTESLTGAKADAGAGEKPVAPAPAEPVTVETGEPERPDDHDEDASIAAAEAELAESIDKVMQSDDRLAAAYAEIKRLTAELAVVKLSRDGYMNGKEAVTRLLKAEQRKVAQLERKLKATA